MCLGCVWVCVRARMRAHEVIQGQVPNFSAPLKMTNSQPRRGLFEVCKDPNPCPVSGWVDGMSLGVCARAHSALEVKFWVNKGQVPNFSAPLKMTISQPRRGLFEFCKGLKPSSRLVLCHKTTRSLLSSSTLIGEHKETPVLDKVRFISGSRLFNKSCHTWPLEYCDLPEWRSSWVKGFYISEISTKMRLASHIHGSVIPYPSLYFRLCLLSPFYPHLTNIKRLLYKSGKFSNCQPWGYCQTKDFIFNENP